MDSQTTASPEKQDRWILIRDVFVFQVKLVVDGFRDLLLLPLSLITGLISLLSGGSRPGPEFYDLLRLARRSERWINLFGAVERKQGPATDDETVAAKDIDNMVSRLESFLVEECRNGSITAQAKERLDTALDTLQGMSKRRKRRQDSRQ